MTDANEVRGYRVTTAFGAEWHQADAFSVELGTLTLTHGGEFVAAFTPGWWNQIVQAPKTVTEPQPLHEASKAA